MRNVLNVKTTENELGLGVYPKCRKKGKPVPIWPSDAALRWGRGGRSLIQKRRKMEWKTRGLKMNVNHYLPTIFSCRRR
jgi:hypothetical protein